MYKLVVDFEMCRVPKNTDKNRFPLKREIIQIGAVLLNETFEVVDSFNSYVYPQFGKLDNFINSLTGIAQRQLKHAPILADAIKQMEEWLGSKQVVVYAWSDSDYIQLSRELSAKGITGELADFLENQDNWVDYQIVFKERFSRMNIYKLSYALECAEIEPEGDLHNGLDDAYNTARLIQKLERNPNYMLVIDEKVLEYQNEEPFGYSFASLLSQFAGVPA